MTAITAKPTEYQGVRFRSRLEARWAVFFDAVGIKWVYEPDTACSEVSYQPDFGVGNWWVEIKPAEWKGDPRDVDRYAELVYRTGRALHIFLGQPGEWKNGRLIDNRVRILLITPDSLDPQNMELVECDRCGWVGTVPPRSRPGCHCLPRQPQLDRAFAAVRDAHYLDAT